MSEIDVCIVTKEGRLPIGLHNIPIRKLIVETSKPLAMARMKAMQKVETDWFAFIDDDVIIEKGWYEQLSKHMRGKVGAITGIMNTIGLSKKLCNDIDEFNNSHTKLIMRLKDRGYTHNTIIRTDLAKDYVPSIRDLSAYEDYDLTQHITKKGYLWVNIPRAKSKHIKTFKKNISNCIWAGKGFKKVHSIKETTIFMAKLLASFPYNVFDLRKSIRFRLFNIVSNIFNIVGLFS